MIVKHFKNILSNKFGLEFSSGQEVTVDKFVSFFFDRTLEGLFLLTGYAGTGKTTLVAALVKTLRHFKYPFVLLAPTGRAAKVFSAYSGEPAFTIHKKIYRQKNAQEGVGFFELGFNTAAQTLFFVDEASMIAAGSYDTHFGSGSLSDDLMEFVYNGRGNRLVMIGDTAQLPPVGSDISPALDPDFLKMNYPVDIHWASLTEIMRQAESSGIVYNATTIREMIGGTRARLLLETRPFKDVRRINGGELLDALEYCYSTYGVDETMVICRSNRQANRYNGGVRARILYREEEITGGDRIMIVKNNYFWGEAYEKIDFIANGDMATVLKVEREQSLYGFRFVRARLQVYGYEEELTAWMMLDTLTSEQPALSQEDNRKLYLAIEEDYSDIASRQKRYKKIQENEFFNALQIKFAYAITGHKSQGGQWNAVFIDPGWYNEEMPDPEYWRWLYTAFTRAREQLYLVNFKEGWFGEPE